MKVQEYIKAVDARRLQEAATPHLLPFCSKSFKTWGRVKSPRHIAGIGKL